ncbi:MAG: hypothetical protein M1530_01410, partial [Candidatus Marsarchaeota archaeon]|nr:hypothetical protein [Candidatus Marsarchaeota archaeon]
MGEEGRKGQNDSPAREKGPIHARNEARSPPKSPLNFLASPVYLPLLGPTPAYYLLLLALFISYIFTKLML